MPSILYQSEIFSVSKVLNVASCLFRRKNDFQLLVALSLDSDAYGELYWDDGESLGMCRLLIMKNQVL